MNTWKFDATHSCISFCVRHMLVSRVRGEFTRWSGELHFDEARPEATAIAARIEAASIDTHEPRRDAHLRSGDFLDAARWPHILFCSHKIERLDGQRFRVTGALTIRGVTRAVTLDVTYGGQVRDPSGAARVGFAARTVIDRKAFGVVFNQVLDTGGLAIGNQLEVQIDVAALRSAETHAKHRVVVA